MFDLNVLPLNLHSGKDQGDLPGLRITKAPRKCERSRAADILLVFITLIGDAPLASGEIQTWLDGIVEKYYNARGSATMGLRAAAEFLNQLVLKRSFSGAREGWQGLAQLNLAVLRKDLLYVVHAGPTHTLVATPGKVEDFFDESNSNSGLGATQAATLRYFQSQVADNGLLVFCAAPPPSWKTDFTSGASMPPGQVLRRLFSQPGNELRAVAVLLKPGSGEIHWRKTSTQEAAAANESRPQNPAHAVTESKSQGPVLAEPSESPAVFPLEPAQPEAIFIGSEQHAAGKGNHPDKELVQQTDVSSSIKTDLYPEHLKADPSTPFKPSFSSERRRRREVRLGEISKNELPPASPPKKPTVSLRKRFAALWFGSRAAGERINQGSRTLAGRMLPESGEKQAGLSTSTMLFIAIAVPLLVAALATTIYFRSGRGEQHLLYLQKAQAAAASASLQADPTQQRLGWEQTIEYLDKADAYGVSNDSVDLRLQAQQVLDQAEGVQRIEYQPAMNNMFAASTRVTRMAADENDVYLLDSFSGRILRMLLTSQGYETDSEFECGPGTFGSLIVGPLIDLAILPPGNSNGATLLAMDRSGTMLYCKPGDTPSSVTLTAPPNGWGNITAFDLFQDTLYLLDPLNNAVWFYEGNNSSFSDLPRDYFDNQRPDLLNAVDLTVNGEDLFILRNNNTLLQCTARVFKLAEAHCTDPAAFGDGRPGREGQQPGFTGSSFSQLLTTQAPDNSLYILDPNLKQIVHFSLRLNLQHYFRPKPSTDVELPDKPITAFTFTPMRWVLIAQDNEIYYSALPY